MDELAAMQACSRSELSYLGTSGIILAGEDNDPCQNLMINVHSAALSSMRPNGSIDAESTASHGSLDINQENSFPTSAHIPSADAKGQAPMPWPNHLPQYMHNFQGPSFQQMPPYQGYLFPGRQVAPPYYPGSMQWPSNKRTGSLEQDEYTEPSDSSSESDSDEHAQHKKKDSSVDQLHRKKHERSPQERFVIRNINYITSKRDGEKDGISQGNSSDEDDFINEAFLKQHVEEAAGSLERQQKTSSHHRKKRSGTKHPHNINGSTAVVDSEGEKRNDSWDAFQNLLLRDREREEVTKQRVVSSDSFVVTGRDTGNEGKAYIKNFEAGENAHLIKKRDSTYEELLFSEGMDGYHSKSGQSIGVKMFDGDSFHTEKNKKDILVDDSFMIQPQSIVNDQSNSHFGTDISMVADIAGATQHQNDASEISQDKLEAFSAHEPDDLYMVLDRDSAAEHVITSWTPEMDYLASNGKSTGSKNSGAPKEKASSKEARPKALGGSLVKSRSEIISRSKKPSPGSRNTIQKSKSEKHVKQVMSIVMGSLDVMTPFQGMDFAFKCFVEKDGIILFPWAEEDSRKKMEELMLQRQKRIAERSAANGFTPTSKKTPFSTKNEKLKTQSSTQESEKLHKPVLRSSTIDRLAAARTNQKAPSTQLRPGQPKKAAVKANGAIATTLSQKAVGPENKKPGMSKEGGLQGSSSTLPIRLTAAQATQPEPVDDYEDIKELHTTSSIEKMKERASEASLVLPEDKTVSDIHVKLVPEITAHPLPASANKSSNTALNIEDRKPVHSRKKWDNVEDSPKATKGLESFSCWSEKMKVSLELIPGELFNSPAMKLSYSITSLFILDCGCSRAGGGPTN
ncbi:COP1-interacting protein 7 [Vitis vinifera]|uniref:COP1-interacting protein 7 n=1 Tax=Vitis vinifera TaxID=29760 RepID=A0A438I8R7_VITVI|nr:COP1-interacting protein 7 [Vitis vinifera]